MILYGVLAWTDVMAALDGERRTALTGSDNGQDLQWYSAGSQR